MRVSEKRHAARISQAKALVPRPSDFPVGSPQSRAAARAMLDKKHLEDVEIIDPLGFLMDRRAHAAHGRLSATGLA
jgi:hypothetical protein